MTDTGTVKYERSTKLETGYHYADATAHVAELEEQLAEAEVALAYATDPLREYGGLLGNTPLNLAENALQRIRHHRKATR